MSIPKITIHQALDVAYKKLANSDLAPKEADLLLSNCLKKEQPYILSHAEQRLSRAQQLAFEQLITKRLQGYSVAALIGIKDFYGLSFDVSLDTLIPRPESELLVDTALEFLRNKDNSSILDVGTGCGNLIIAIARNAPQGDHYKYYASDISNKALSIAKKNTKQHHATIRFFHSNLFSNTPKKKFELITANLPYLTSEQLLEPTIRQEPVGALWGGVNGLDIYREFFKQVINYLARDFMILIEIDPGQKNELLELIRMTLNDVRTDCLKDLSDTDRVLKIQNQTSDK